MFMIDDNNKNKIKDIIYEIEQLRRNIQDIRGKCTELLSEAKELGITSRIINKVLKARQTSLTDQQDDAIVEALLEILN